MGSKIPLTAQEYVIAEIGAKKFGFKTVNELVSTAIISFFSDTFGWNIKPEDSRKFVKKLNEETAKNPNLDIEEFIRNFNSLSIIEKEKVTVEIPKKLLAFLKDKRKADLDEYLSNCLTDTVAADIEADVFGDSKRVQAEYGLKEEFKAYTGH